MARWAYTTAALALLAAWAGAQGPAPPLDAADRLRLLKANGTLIDNLVDHGVELSRADAVEKRAEQCRRAAKALASAIQDAAARQEAERVAELSVLFREVVRDALLPTLDHGRRTVTPDSPAGQQLQKVREVSARDVTELKAALPATGKVADSPRVKDAVKELDALGEKLEVGSSLGPRASRPPLRVWCRVADTTAKRPELDRSVSNNGRTTTTTETQPPSDPNSIAAGGTPAVPGKKPQSTYGSAPKS